ncbi:aldehyde dehydrogenase family protein [Herbiconiux ginsengi]|uniref:Aldehyde dehydrogenase n=1 Tax=Herbiconiux ginsengi TaxID=381665 RepID=A0A1H3TEJ5_9MICO|nr:aldehyde dehydrogenase family protein [Herbiconiux ginsengi]SDZ48241.1 aldehyde dehydrogenase (NAD+) [Herbiconiux ginsengi]
MSISVESSVNPEITDIPVRVADIRRGFERGITRPFAWRREQLSALDRLLEDNHIEIEEAVYADLHKPRLESFITEIKGVRSEIKTVLKNLKKWTGRRSIPFAPAVMSQGFIQREPLGTVLVIAPWNYPVNLLLSPVVGAIAAGNAVVMKPSELAPRTSALIARLVAKYLDGRAVTVVEGGISETTELLSLAWDHIFYTGNGTVGRIVLKAAAEHFTPVTLELGGKTPAWVDPSADIATAANWLAWGKFLNTGQTCVAPDYVLTTPAVQPKLIEALQKEITAFYGTDPRSSPDYGRIINDRHHDRLTVLLEGADIAIGGQVARDDRFIAPTVLRDVRVTDPAMHEEIFGPILPIITVDEVDEAIAVVNRGDKPLSMYLFSTDQMPIDSFLTRTSSGSVAINASLIQNGIAALPFGGVGASGMGSYHGEQSVRTFSHERSVVKKVTWLPNLVKFTHPPFTSKKEKQLRGA